MKRITLFTLFLVILAALGFSQANLQPAAIVNLIRSVPITVGQLRTEVENIERATRRTLTQAQRLEVLDGMINEQLVLQAAERDNLTATDNEVTQQVNQLRSAMTQQLGRQPTEAEFSQAIREQTGMEMRAFQEQLKRTITMQRFLMEKKGTLINSITPPTDAEIRAAFERNRRDFFIPATVGFSAVQILYGADAAARTRARTLADSLAREIGNNSARFDQVSARAQTANSGFQSGSQVVPQTDEARVIIGQALFDMLFSMSLNQVSGVIEGTNGFFIVKVTSQTAYQNLNLTDVIPDQFLPNVPSGNRITVRDYVGQALLAEKQQAILARASEELVAELRAIRPTPFTRNDRNVNW